MDKSITTILIVDDNENNLFSLEKTIIENIEDVKIYKANSGEIALDIAYNKNIDLIILDIQMPKMDGFEIAKYLNVSPKTRHIPVIFLTAIFKDDEFKQKGFDLGAIDYLTKPLDEYKLITQIKLYIRIFNKERMNNILENKIKEESEKRLSQERLMFQQSKMATMGEMISNIAHQWRQPLAAIVNSVDYLHMLNDMDTLQKDELSRELENISQTAIFLSKTINTFRNFFKDDKELTKFYLSEVIQDTLSIVEKNLVKNKIFVIEDIENVQVMGLKNELEQSLLNIINNAKDKLVENEDNKQRFIFLNTKDLGDEVLIEILDNGGGIQSHIISKIFEPYFTTKHQSQGTGIGLYITYQIIVTHLKGSISVSNKIFEYEGKLYNGAEFLIKIPKEYI